VYVCVCATVWCVRGFNLTANSSGLTALRRTKLYHHSAPALAVPFARTRILYDKYTLLHCVRLLLLLLLLPLLLLLLLELVELRSSCEALWWVV